MARSDTKECTYCKQSYTRKKRDSEQWSKSKWCSLSCLGLSRTGEKHPTWREKPSYGTIHKYIEHKYGPKISCEKCSDDYYLHWANISGLYKRDRADWMVLCVKCHSNYDKTWLKRDSTKTHCLRGHPYEGDNIYTNPKSNERSCRACWKSRYHEAKQRIKEGRK